MTSLRAHLVSPDRAQRRAAFRVARNEAVRAGRGQKATAKQALKAGAWTLLAVASMTVTTSLLAHAAEPHQSAGAGPARSVAVAPAVPGPVGSGHSASSVSRPPLLQAGPALAARTDSPSVSIDLGGTSGQKGGPLSSGISTALLLGVVSLVPSLLVMMTAFTRIVIVLGLTRSAIGTQNIPPTQVLVGLALILSIFVMGPALSKANHDGVQPYLKGQITQSQAYDRTIEPFREFMLSQVREKDLALMVKLSDEKRPKTAADVPTQTLIPAFVISELRTAFLIGFIILIPFLVIDIVVASVLSSVNMVMLPPALVSLPFKLLLFVAADGWYLVVEALVRSFGHG